LKTAIRTWLVNQKPEILNDKLPDIAASVQQAIIEPLVNKSVLWARQHKIPYILLAGGVAANSALRKIHLQLFVWITQLWLVPLQFLNF
jgi:N6-L-threonylcarbamoyladenine synthase